MYRCRVLRDICVPELARLRALLRDCRAEHETCLLFQKHHAHLSPSELVQAAAVLRQLNSNPGVRLQLPADHCAVRSIVSSDIRGKLYALTDPAELCDIVVGIVKHDIASKALIADFTGRLERLLPAVKGGVLSHVCNCIVFLHQQGYRVVPICSKLFAYLAAHGSGKEYTLQNHVALLSCMDALCLRHEALVTTIGRQLQMMLSSGVKIPPDDIICLLQSYNDEMFGSVYIRHRLIDMALDLYDGDGSLADVSAKVVSLDVVAQCLNAGVFPSKCIEKIDSIVSAGCSTSSRKTRLSILRGYGNLRYKPMDVLDILLCRAREDAPSMKIFSDVVNCVHSLFLLDLKDETIVQHACEIVKHNDAPLEIKDIGDICNILVALCHFGVRDTAVYQVLLNELMRLSCSLQHADTAALQTVAIYLWKCMDDVFAKLSTSIKSFLAEVLTKESNDPLILNSSDLQDEVGKTATFISYTLYKEVSVGPYLVDFVRRLGDDEIGEMRQRDNRFHRLRDASSERQLASKLRDCAFILFTDDQSQFYRNTRDRTSEYQFHLAVLRGLGFRCVNVPYWEWQVLRGWQEKRLYLQRLLERHTPVSQPYSH
ncbi:hypothetical protein X943_002124 [Babesia divergens]|uniref:RAP domain-containing protein n=1 Tax=Babesia divergens TaxID=32595 RepID=A0AAD9LI88_BABDI|nr:hypothetical protein X943_002124 [Babesia divergens]